MDYTNSINFTNNSCNISSTNLLKKFSNQQFTSDQNSDTITISNDLIVDMHYCKDKLAEGSFVKGRINNKPATLKVVTNHENESWFEGSINNKYAILHSKNKQYDGRYGDYNFNLSVEYNEPSKISNFFKEKILGKSFIPDYFIIAGKIGDKTVNITLPNAKIPYDEETKDIIAMVLEDNGLKAQTINGEVKSLKYSPSAIKDLKKRIEKREKTINNDIKPIFMQGLSTATGAIIGSVVSAMLLKIGLKR